MGFLKSLLYNFLCVFFVNHLVPDIVVASYAKLPHIEGAIIFAFSVGIINSAVFPLLRLFQVPVSYLKIGIITCIISFAAYSIVNLLPIGIKVISIKGFLISACIVWIVAYLTNHMQFSKYKRHLEEEAILKKKEEQEKKKEEEKK
ncbi:MAG TPA: phage holin family protein [Chlamydiales bacterium]|nr:phage holin family protein [Chlamydiales bacterium]